MSFLLNLDEERLSEQLPALIESFESDTAKAQLLFKTEGERLEDLMRQLPYHQVYYAKRAQEAKHLVKWLETHLSRIEGRCAKNYLQGQRAVGPREITLLTGGERDVVEAKQLLCECSLAAQHLDEVVDGFKQLAWMLGHVTKLRVAELQDVIL